MPRVRSPTHAGSWYDDDKTTLDSKIEGWMTAARASVTPAANVRAIIGPHAGYSYCGHVMAYAYAHIDPLQVRRVFLLGPSHHLYSKHCLLSGTDAYATPLGDIQLDKETIAELAATGKFARMEQGVDEAEHSLELHLPFLVHAMQGRPFTLVPIMVGAVSTASEAAYGRLLAPYLSDPATLFIASSDFCHWGSRFSYTFYDASKGPIHASIEWLDRRGIAAIEGGDPEEFSAYLRETGNTICGRHPIAVLMNALQLSGQRHAISFTKYDQSHRCLGPRDSSVSYAAAVVTEAAAGENGSDGMTNGFGANGITAP